MDHYRKIPGSTARALVRNSYSLEGAHMKGETSFFLNTEHPTAAELYSGWSPVNIDQ